MDLIGTQPRGVCVGENQGNGSEVVTPVVTATQDPIQELELARLVTAWPALQADVRAKILVHLDALCRDRAG